MKKSMLGLGFLLGFVCCLGQIQDVTQLTQGYEAAHLSGLNEESFSERVTPNEDSAKCLHRIKTKIRIGQTFTAVGVVLFSLAMNPHLSLDAQNNLAGSGMYTIVPGVLLWTLNERKYDIYLKQWNAPGRKKMFWGRFFIYGSVFVLTETALFTLYQEPSSLNSGLRVLVETIFIGSGAALLTTGILLRKNGQKKYNSYKTQAVSFQFVPRINSLGLRVRF